MKTLIISFCMLCTFFIVPYSAFNKNKVFDSYSYLLTNKKWKIEEMYIQKVRVVDVQIDLWRWKFEESGEYLFTTGNKSDSKSWVFNKEKTKIYTQNGNNTEETFDIIHLDSYHLIIKTNKVSSKTNTLLEVEYRLTPE